MFPSTEKEKEFDTTTTKRPNTPDSDAEFEAELAPPRNLLEVAPDVFGALLERLNTLKLEEEQKQEAPSPERADGAHHQPAEARAPRPLSVQLVQQTEASVSAFKPLASSATQRPNKKISNTDRCTDENPPCKKAFTRLPRKTQ